MQWMKCPIDDHSESTRTALPHFFAKMGECRWQVILLGNRGAQVQHQFAAFDHHVIRFLQGFFKDLTRRLVFSELRCRGMESQQQALNPLKKRVVQFVRDTFSLFQSRLETLVHSSGGLSQSQPIQRPEESCRRHYAQSPEPCRLVQCRCNRKTQRGTCFIPDAIVIACNYVERVVAWLQIRIERLATALRILPFGIVPVQSVS